LLNVPAAFGLLECHFTRSHNENVWNLCSTCMEDMEKQKAAPNRCCELLSLRLPLPVEPRSQAAAYRDARLEQSSVSPTGKSGRVGDYRSRDPPFASTSIQAVIRSARGKRVPARMRYGGVTSRRKVKMRYSMVSPACSIDDPDDVGDLLGGIVVETCW
jgi:hypothetical protein